MLESQERELEAHQAALAQARTALSALEAEVVDCRLKCERARTMSEELARAFAEKFRLEFDALASELAAALSGRDGERDEQRLSELRARAERIGEVNLAAELPGWRRFPRWLAATWNSTRLP
jgi:chromosome segregation ATPase